MATYAFTLITDMGKSLLEVFFNFIRKPGSPPLEILSPSECLIVIPCHNSADCIIETLITLPPKYEVICVSNASTDSTFAMLKAAQLAFPNLTVLNTPEPGKIRAVILGVLQARNKGLSHFLLLDDDVLWPQENGKPSPLTVYDKSRCVTALPVVPSKHDQNWIRSVQAIEYQIMCASKRAQGNLGNVIMASGAAGIFRVESFLDVIQEHDGQHIGDDLQCSFLHHVKGMKIDFNSESVVATHPPDTFKAWWKQRSKRWEASPILNLKWSMKIIFAPLGKRNPGWWIRGMAAYRNLVVVNDLMRCLSFPLMLIYSPIIVIGVWLITYCCVLLKMLAFVIFFKNENYVRADLATVIGVLTYPFYGVLMWLSRVRAIFQGIYLIYSLRGARRPLKFVKMLGALEEEVLNHV